MSGFEQFTMDDSFKNMFTNKGMFENTIEYFSNRVGSLFKPQAQSKLPLVVTCNTRLNPDQFIRIIEHGLLIDLGRTCLDIEFPPIEGIIQALGMEHGRAVYFDITIPCTRTVRIKPAVEDREHNYEVYNNVEFTDSKIRALRNTNKYSGFLRVEETPQAVKAVELSGPITARCAIVCVRNSKELRFIL